MVSRRFIMIFSIIFLNKRKIADRSIISSLLC